MYTFHFVCSDIFPEQSLILLIIIHLHEGFLPIHEALYCDLSATVVYDHHVFLHPWSTEFLVWRETNRYGFYFLYLTSHRFHVLLRYTQLPAPT